MLQAVNPDHEVETELSFPYMALYIGNVKLLALQSSIVSIASAQEIDFEMPSRDSIGWLDFNKQKVPVYSLTERLDIEHSASPENTICVVIKDNDAYIALMCQQAIPFRNNIIKLYSLPDCMQSTASPIDTLCLHKNGTNSDISYFISHNSLLNFIMQTGI